MLKSKILNNSKDAPHFTFVRRLDINAGCISWPNFFYAITTYPASLIWPAESMWSDVSYFCIRYGAYSLDVTMCIG